MGANSAGSRHVLLSGDEPEDDDDHDGDADEDGHGDVALI